MTILKALHHQAGVQNQGVQIKPDDETIEPMANVVFVGMFKRGRVDCPFKVTENNFRALLGYDPRNQVYQAIEDAFKTGLSHVWVQRVTNNSPWGDWIVNPGVTIEGTVARYTGYKTNGYKYFDSFANVDLTDAIARSFNDTNMQQWQGFKDAIGSNSFTWDGGFHISFTKVRYKGYGYIKPASSINWSNPAIFYVDTFDYGLFQNTAIQQFGQTSWDHMRIKYAGPPNPNQQNEVYVLTNGYNQISLKVVEETIQVTMTFVEIAQKIISNLQSSNEGTSLLAEAYLEAVANSIFNTNPSKQFVKLSDLIAQFEQNKILRT